MKLAIKNILGHFKTITAHRHLVISHSKRAGILFQGLFHDLSKYSPREFWVGAKYYSGNKSPNEAERRDTGYSTAWMHHKGRNRHHFEYWSDYDINTHIMTPMPMPPRYIAEMFCDRVAASKIYQGEKYTNKHPLEYFLKEKTTLPIHPDTAEILEDLLITLADYGEDAAFRKVRIMIKK